MQAVLAVLVASELEPAGHARQAASTVAPTVAEYFATAQSVQPALPVALLYFPVAQAVHVPPSGPVYPALQVHAVAALQPLHDAPEFEGHV